MADSDCIVVMGSNMAENHPVAFRWPMKAKVEHGAKIIHVDPRFTRTSAVADIYAPVRAGSDIAFLGGVISYVLNSEKWNTDPFFKTFVVNYTNAATIINDDFKDTEDLDGVFSGLLQSKGGINEWPFNGITSQYDGATWQYARTKVGAQGEAAAATAQSGEKKVSTGADRTTSFAYAVAWTQHTYGVQIIGACALLQLLLGNIGRPGAGVMALRGHASIQGSTDVPTLYHSIHGYMSAPSVLKKHDSLRDWLLAETTPRGYWANTPKFMVSYLKSMYGAAATTDNDFGYDWHPKIIGDHSHLPMFVAMNEGRVKGMLCVGQNPATSLNASVERQGLARLEWLVVKDNWLTETATFWQNSPEITKGKLRSQDVRTEVFFFPAAQVAEYEGSFTNTQRMLQWHSKAAEPPGDCRTDLWLTHQLATRLKKLYAESTLPRDRGFKNLVWDYDSDDPHERGRGEPDAVKILKEINGHYTDDPSRHLAGFGDLKDDGSTTCASWIYCGVFPSPDRNLAARKQPDPPNTPGAQLQWGWAWPANRRVLYNRASADLQGKPWSERKKWVWWDGAKWTGYDVPDFAPNKAPQSKAAPDAIGLDALSGSEPFIMKPDGVGWLYVPTGLVDGPLPAHYEPAESPVRNPLYRQQSSPVLKYWKLDGNALAPTADPRFPYIATTYRLTEHYLSGAMSRWNPWLTELQPEFFVEISPELAAEKGIGNTDWISVSTPRGRIRGKALVTRRLRPFTIAGRTVHHVGMPFHWGYQGLVTGDAANELTALVADPNVSIHEGKAFVCNLEKLGGGLRPSSSSEGASTAPSETSPRRIAAAKPPLE